MRSLLFVPGDSPRKMERALASGADALILDLEDSVAPQAKAEARTTTARFLQENEGVQPLFFVRVNDFSTGLTEADLASVLPGRPHGIVQPKACGAMDVTRLSAMLRVAEARSEVSDGVTKIIPIITETAAALLAAPSFSAEMPRLYGLSWGAEDLSADIGARTNRDEHGRYTDVFRHARTMTLLAANAVRTAAIDTVFVDFRDLDGLQKECEAAERDGFTAKLAIHPAQIEVINRVFTPSQAAVAKAKMVIAAFAEAGDPGVLAIDGVMYDQPHRRQAERLLARATAAGID